VVGTTNRAVVSEYDTVPDIRVLLCCTTNVDVLIVRGSIGLLKVAVIIFTAETFVVPAVPLIFNFVAFLFKAVGVDIPALPLILKRGSLAPPFTGVVRITVGAMQTLTIPGVSSRQPLIKTTKSMAVINPAESEAPRILRFIREKGDHGLKAVFGFVVEVFIEPSANS